jgi:hypothetical protein
MLSPAPMLIKPALLSSMNEKGRPLRDNECRDQRKSSIKSFRSGLCDIVERPFLRGNSGLDLGRGFRGFPCA